MIITFRYSQINNPDNNYGVAEFARHLEYLIGSFEIVTPFDKLEINNKHPKVCLTFDGAYFDFYYYVYPLLKKYKIKAILAIPVAFIRTRSILPDEERLKVSSAQAMNKINLQNNTPLCTWDEIKEMVSSNLVIPASNSYTYIDLTSGRVNLKQEIADSKKILEDKLLMEVNCFVYPHGKADKEVTKYVSRYYDYAFVNGGSLNKNWESKNKLYYRVNAEEIWPRLTKISKDLINKFKLRYYLNKLRS